MFDPEGTRLDLGAVVFPHETDIAEAGMSVFSDLNRTICDLRSFAIPRELPLLFDILEAAIDLEDKEEDDDEFIIFTNSDIHLMPHFYSAVEALINRGYESLILNRRTISRFPPDARLLPLMYSEIGIDHPGLDCFVFPKRIFRRFVRSEVCVGVPFVMRSLLFNMVAFSRRLLITNHAHFTFHLGNEMFWNDPKLQDYIDYNVAETMKLLSTLCSDAAMANRIRPIVKSLGHPLEIQHLPNLQR